MRLRCSAVLLAATMLALASPWGAHSQAQNESTDSRPHSDEPSPGESGGVDQAQSVAPGDRASQLGGPDQVDVLIGRDAERTSRTVKKSVLKSYFDWKQGLQEKHGLSLGLDYSGAYFDVSGWGGEGDDSAGSGMVRFFGSWDLVGRGTPNAGAVVWKVEHRHAYTDIPVAGLGFEVGYLGLFLPPFNDNGARLTNFYWRQRMGGGRATLFAGYLDATDYVDVYLLASPWTGFTNFAFSTGALTMAVPNDAGFGFALGTMLSDEFFLIGGVVDRNGDPTDPFHSAERFFSDNEYFKSIEIGWTPSQGEIYSHNAHLTFWHGDEREVQGADPEGWGLNFSYVQSIGKWMPFLRAGYAEEGGSLMQSSVSTGFSFQPVPNSDSLGVGINWGEPNEDTWGPGLDDQWTFEVFYLWQLAKVVALTPSLQYLVDPALDSDESSLWAYGLRLRAAF